jgi:NADPH:quinone reductase-like Zn-dependent oxidoreductase
MRKIELKPCGPSSKLKSEEVPVPERNGRFLVVKVKAASLSHWNVKYRRGISPDILFFGEQVIVSGEVVLPSTDNGFTDRLSIKKNQPTGVDVIGLATFGLPGDNNRSVQTISDIYQKHYYPDFLSGWSDYALVPIDWMMKKPPFVSHEQASVFPLPYFEAMTYLSHFGSELESNKRVVVLNAAKATAYMLAVALSLRGESELILTCQEPELHLLRSTGLGHVVLQGGRELKKIAREGCGVVDATGSKPLREVVRHLPAQSNICSSMEYDAHDSDVQDLCAKRKVYINGNREQISYLDELKRLEGRASIEQMDFFQYWMEREKVQGGKMITKMKNMEMDPVLWDIYMDSSQCGHFWPFQPRSFPLGQIRDAHLLMEACPWAGPVAICP